jgi:hypothetical protein
MLFNNFRYEFQVEYVQHIFQCYKHNQMQFDQTAFLKRLFHLNTVKEVENKFQELQDTSKH